MAKLQQEDAEKNFVQLHFQLCSPVPKAIHSLVTLMHQLAFIVTTMILQYFSLFLYHWVFKIFLLFCTSIKHGSQFVRLGGKDLYTSTWKSVHLFSLWKDHMGSYKANEKQRHLFVRRKEVPRVCKTLGELEKWVVLGIYSGEGRESYNRLVWRRVREMKAGKILQRNCSLSLCYWTMYNN